MNDGGMIEPLTFGAQFKVFSNRITIVGVFKVDPPLVTTCCRAT